jgi:hypothetical protein
MAQQISALGGCTDAGTASCAKYGPPHRLTRNWDEWGGRCDKDAIAGVVWSSMSQIVQDRLSDFLWEPVGVAIVFDVDFCQI